MAVQVTNLINEPIVLTSIGSYTLKPFETKRFENLIALTSELPDQDLRRKIQAEVVSDDRHLTSDEVNSLRKSRLVSADGIVGGRERKGYSYVDETVQVNGNTSTGDMLPTAAQVAAGSDRLILGGDSLLTGAPTSSIAQSTRALAIQKFAATDTLPTAEQVRQGMMQLRASPNRLILRGAL